MLHNTKTISPIQGGFTLVEILIAITILGGLALIGVRLIYDSLSYRSKQRGIEESSEAVRALFSKITAPIQTATTIIIPSSTQLTVNGFTSSGGTYCASIRLNGTAVEATNAASGCNTGYIALHSPSIQINSLSFASDSGHIGVVNASISGQYKDSLGTHAFYDHTTIFSRAMQ
jgi:prepilin-type N-terminal cleavage/methylation domain-containing protein